MEFLLFKSHFFGTVPNLWTPITSKPPPKHPAIKQTSAHSCLTGGLETQTPVCAPRAPPKHPVNTKTISKWVASQQQRPVTNEPPTQRTLNGTLYQTPPNLQCELPRIGVCAGYGFVVLLWLDKLSPSPCRDYFSTQSQPLLPVTGIFFLQVEEKDVVSLELRPVRLMMGRGRWGLGVGSQSPHLVQCLAILQFWPKSDPFRPDLRTTRKYRQCAIGILIFTRNLVFSDPLRTRKPSGNLPVEKWYPIYNNVRVFGRSEKWFSISAKNPKSRCCCHL